MEKKGKGRVIPVFVFNVPKKFRAGIPACRGAIDPYGWGIDMGFPLTLDDLKKVTGKEEKEPDRPS